ncbi:hypothetical protein [Pontivivens ytuae]|uniref:Uncharacterized protein n=1 Tax=Pontivivens ytuae TaxID=2789856 RepID=A0A7S9QDL7_9RHOB|nr:hypothetical protein [Pontivivens ytuae]QPH55413.1 hypothetical protein I0K15_06675 [Pontivivens ytuae]
MRISIKALALAAALMAVISPAAAQDTGNHHLQGLTGLTAEQLDDMTMEEIAIVIQTRQAPSQGS